MIRLRPRLIHLREIRGIPKWARPIHPHVRKHTYALAIGSGIMLVGTGLTFEWLPLPHIIAHLIGNSLHGIGLIPFVHHAEPFFKLITAE